MSARSSTPWRWRRARRSWKARRLRCRHAWSRWSARTRRCARRVLLRCGDCCLALKLPAPFAGAAHHAGPPRCRASLLSVDALRAAAHACCCAVPARAHFPPDRTSTPLAHPRSKPPTGAVYAFGCRATTVCRKRRIVRATSCPSCCSSSTSRPPPQPPQQQAKAAREAQRLLQAPAQRSSKQTRRRASCAPGAPAAACSPPCTATCLRSGARLTSLSFCVPQACNGRGRARSGTSGLLGMSSSLRSTTRRRPRSTVGLREYALSCAAAGHASAHAPGARAAHSGTAAQRPRAPHAPRTAKVSARW